MINRIIEFSMKNRWLILGLYAAIAVWGYWALLHTPIDAIPDLSENQVIVFTEWQGRSPQEVEDQITYPLTANLQGLPHVRTVRSSSATSTRRPASSLERVGATRRILNEASSNLKVVGRARAGAGAD